MTDHFPGTPPAQRCPRCRKNMAHAGHRVCLPCLERCENQPGHEDCEPDWCKVVYVGENGR